SHPGEDARWSLATRQRTTGVRTSRQFGELRRLRQGSEDVQADDGSQGRHDGVFLPWRLLLALDSRAAHAEGVASSAFGLHASALSACLAALWIGVPRRQFLARARRARGPVLLTGRSRLTDQVEWSESSRVRSSLSSDRARWCPLTQPLYNGDRFWPGADS